MGAQRLVARWQFLSHSRLYEAGLKWGTQAGEDLGDRRTHCLSSNLETDFLGNKGGIYFLGLDWEWEWWDL